MREGDIEIGECWVRLDRGLSPDDDCIVVTRADPHVLVCDEMLAELDPRFAHFGDGVLTIHGRDGDVSYGLSHYDPLRMLHVGTRSG